MVWVDFILLNVIIVFIFCFMNYFISVNQLIYQV